MPNWKKVVVSGSDARLASLFTTSHITGSGHISGSLISTGSFGRVETAGYVSAEHIHSTDDMTVGDDLTVTGNINTTTGRVLEQGNSVIDHATAMAIVFGG